MFIVLNEEVMEKTYGQHSDTTHNIVYYTDDNPYSDLSNTYMENYTNTNTIMMNIHQFNNVHDIEMEIKYLHNLLDLYRNKIGILENLISYTTYKTRDNYIKMKGYYVYKKRITTDYVHDLEILAKSYYKRNVLTWYPWLPHKRY